MTSVSSKKKLCVCGRQFRKRCVCGRDQKLLSIADEVLHSCTKPLKPVRVINMSASYPCWTPRNPIDLDAIDQERRDRAAVMKMYS